MSEERKTEKMKLIDAKTGEVQDVFKLGDDYALVHKNSSKAYKDLKRLEELSQGKRGRNWIACYHEPIKKTANDMTLFECGTLLKLLLYINFKDKEILTKDGKPMKLKDIKEVIKKGETQTRHIMTRLEEKGIIKKEKVGRNNVYKVNSEFHTMGEILEKVPFTKLYQGKAKELLEKINLNQAGILYKILPYFHYSKCYLCLNPNEEDDSKIQFLSQEELATLISIDPDTVLKHMKALRDQSVVLDTRSGKTVMYYVHPELMFRMQQETKDTEAVRTMFENHEIKIKNRKNKNKFIH